MGTASEGLLRFRPEEAEGADEAWLSVADLAGATVTALDVEIDGRVWAAVNGGVAVVAGEPPAQTAFLGPGDGLPEAEILSIHAAPAGGIWIGTDAGLVRYAGP